MHTFYKNLLLEFWNKKMEYEKMESPTKTFEMHFDKLIANETNDIQIKFLQTMFPLITVIILI